MKTISASKEAFVTPAMRQRLATLYCCDLQQAANYADRL